MDDPTGTTRELVTAWLGAKRRHVVETLEGLDDASARRVVVPSGWSVLHVVQHLALDVERFWFDVVVAGGEDDAETAGAWVLPPPATVHEAVVLYERHVARSDEVLAGLAWDAPVARPDDVPFSRVGEVATHVLVETSTHAGHLDVARELLDGHQRLVVDPGPSR